MGDNKKFKSPTGSLIRVCLPDGGVARIEGEWVELPERFHAGAYAQGAISDDMFRAELQAMLAEQLGENAGAVKSVEAKLTKHEKKKSDMATAISLWIEDNAMEHFSRPPKGGPYKPKVADLSEAIGERVYKEERDEVWYKLLEDGLEVPES